MRIPFAAVLALAALASIASAGCGEIRVRTVPEYSDETVLRSRRETVIGPEVTAKVESEGGRVYLSATRICAVHAMRDVSRTVRYARYDANAGGTRGLGIAGASLGAAGGLFSALPAMPAKTDHAADLGFGIPLAALGVTLAAAAIVDAARARTREEKVELASVDDGAVGPAAPCPELHRAARGEVVVGKVAGIGGAAIPLGKTDWEGRLEIDLSRLPAGAVKNAPEPRMLSLFIHEGEVGQVSLETFARAAEALAWSEVNVGLCTSELTRAACLPLERFLDEHPAGLHAAEARATIERLAPMRRAREDAEMVQALTVARQEERSRRAEAKREAAIQAASMAARRAAVTTCVLTCKARCITAECTTACLVRGCNGAGGGE